jgi:hypothetical protein
MRCRQSILISAFIILSAVSLTACGPIGSTRSTATPQPTPDLKGTLIPDLILTLTANRLDKPKPVDNHSSQADKGAATYWLVCIPCHGDKGQGLTDEWRLVFGVDEMNCWQSRCHATNHPPDGFIFPHLIPPVLGPNTLTRYATAADLHAAIQARMPWYNPRVLSAEEDWNVTAYLMRANGVLPANLTLDEGNATVLRLHVPPPSTTEERPIAIGVLGFLLVAVLAIVYYRARRN